MIPAVHSLRRTPCNSRGEKRTGVILRSCWVGHAGLAKTNMNPKPASPKVAVVRADGHYSVQAHAACAAGETLLHVDGQVVDRPSRYSIQIGVDEHVDPPLVGTLEDDMDRHVWRFLNHSCEPNATLRGRRLVALRAIARFEEITFDYNTNEFDMACPFPCACGAPTCLGIIRGYRHLSQAQRERIAPLAAPHLHDLIEAERS